MVDPRILARVRDVPGRWLAALITFGLILGLPLLFAFLCGLFAQLDLDVLAFVCGFLAFGVFFVAVIGMWIVIFRARSRLKIAETALFAGDFDTATRRARGVIATVFRSDYQMGALFTLALAAERLGAFAEAAALFGRALGMVPAMSAQRPRRRASALLAAHATLDLAAMNDLPRAGEMLARCHRELGPVGQPGALEALMFMDDSGFGAIGINTMLVELENKREPRPLAVLAWTLVMLKSGQAPQVLAAFAHEGQALAYGLAPHEQALAARIHALASQQVGSPAAPPPPNEWAEKIA